MYIAHKKDDQEQTLLDHLQNTANLAQSNAANFGGGDLAHLIGLLHDVGKYSKEFQKRINNNGPIVDHSTAGAQLIFETYDQDVRLLPAFCIAGHHGGLPNCGTKADNCQAATLRGRLQKLIPDYQAYSDEITLPGLPTFPKLKIGSSPGFAVYVLTKMLYSSLIDADFTDTNDFMSGIKYAIDCSSISQLSQDLTSHLASFGQDAEATPINTVRQKIQSSCIEQAAGQPGFYRLTVPTGGGKTLSGMAFALQHAQNNGLERVIYTIPYTSIIEQNAAIYKDIFGADNVLEHHSEFDFKDLETDNLRLAAEKWDMPIVVTTNVQFFESFFSNKSSRSRKLHNVAKSVIVLDEAQMLPLNLLLPCVDLLVDLVLNYHCTVVFCTATQPALERFLPKKIEVAEICPLSPDDYLPFKRNTIEHLGAITKADLCAEICQNHSSLTIVNRRKLALDLYKQLPEENKYYLTTLLCPIHRKAILKTVRERLKAGQACTVVATSLIEAGVDVDFSAVYRQMAGLDSIIQAAGRCNREGKLPEAKLQVFELSDDGGKPPLSMARNIEVSKSIFRQFAEVSSPEAIKCYFEQLYDFATNQGLDALGIRRQLAASFMDIDFAEIAQKFKLIETNTQSVIIPFDGNAKEWVEALEFADGKGGILRKLQPYTVNIYPNEYNYLLGSGKIKLVAEEVAVLQDMTSYSKDLGLDIIMENGLGIFI